MNTYQRVLYNDIELRRCAELYKFLEKICQDLDLTRTQLAKARSAYAAVSAWLASSTLPLFAEIDVYPQGSIGLGTATRPIGQDEFDVDLICLFLLGHPGMSPADIKHLVGYRLAENETYRKMLEEKKRCWRLNYAGDFHMDISSTIPNARCVNQGEFVTDKQLAGWHPTNPRAYRALFERRAQIAPRLRGSSTNTRAQMSATIEPFPDYNAFKGILRRLVQLLKRHRDYHFLNVEEDIAPISIIITTLAMQSYEFCARRFEHQDELDVLIATIQMMPHFIDTKDENGRPFYAVWNETTEGENFADRWNREPARANAFYQWHSKALKDIEALRDSVGIDRLVASACGQFGDRVVERVMEKRNQAIGSARTAKSLGVGVGVGLTTSSAAASQNVPKNTFYGD